eukprot:tig00021319_g20244.t1
MQDSSTSTRRQSSAPLAPTDLEQTPMMSHLSLAQNFLIKQYNFWSRWKDARLSSVQKSGGSARAVSASRKRAASSELLPATRRSSRRARPAEISKIVSEISGDGGELEPSVHGLILLLHRWPFRIDLCVEIKRLLLSVLRVSNIPTHFAVGDFSVGASVLERLFQEQDNFSLVVEAHHFEQQTPTGRGIWLEDEDEENLDDDLKPADPNAAPEVSTFSVDDFFA